MAIITYKNYEIEVISTPADWKYTIKLNEKLIVGSSQGFPFPSEAEIHAKLYINRISAQKDGWIIT